MAPGSVTKAFSDDTARVASPASVISVLLLAFKNDSACALTESSNTVFPFAEAYNDDNEPATLETSRFRASESPAKLLDALWNTPIRAAADAALTDMSDEHVRNVAPRESVASIPSDLTPLATIMDANVGAADEPNTWPLEVELHDVVNASSRYLTGESASLHIAVKPEALFSIIRSLVCMAVTGQPLPISPTHSSDVTDNTAPPHSGGELTAMDIDASATALVKMLVTRHVNLTAAVASTKKLPFTTRLGD